MVNLINDQAEPASPEQPPRKRRGTGPSQPFELDDGIGTVEEEHAAKPKKTLSFYMSITMLALVAFVASWEATTLAVAIPTITRKLHGTTLESFWASIAFMLGVVVTQPIYSSVSDVLGRKFPLYAATVVFSVGSIVFALANNMSILILGRVLQGLGGGGLDVLQAVILSDITTLKERPLYIGFMSLAIAVGSVTGPAVGAAFTDYVEWRWIGWVNLPFTGIILLLIFFFLHLQPLDMTLSAKIRRLDWGGMLLFATGTSFFALSLSWADALYPWASWKTLTPLIVGALLLVTLIFYEARPVEPVFPPRIFSGITLGTALVSGFFNGMIMYSLILYLPLFFQATFLRAPLRAALSALPVCLVSVGFSFVSSIVMELTRRYRLQLCFGWVLTAVFLGLWSRVGENTSWAENYSLQAFLGVGIGTVFTTTAIQLQAGVERVDDMGIAAGLLVVFRLFGALIGQSIGAAVFSSVFQRSLAAKFAELPEALEVLRDPTRAIGLIPSLGDLNLLDGDMRKLIKVYQEPFHTLWMVMASFSCLGVLASVLTKELSLEREDVGRQGFERRST